METGEPGLLGVLAVSPAVEAPNQDPDSATILLLPMVEQHVLEAQQKVRRATLKDAQLVRSLRQNVFIGVC
jgi:hypothetical protein